MNTIYLRLSGMELKALENMADDNDTDIDDIVTKLVRDGLSEHGYLDLGHTVSSYVSVNDYQPVRSDWQQVSNDLRGAMGLKKR